MKIWDLQNWHDSPPSGGAPTDLLPPDLLPEDLLSGDQLAGAILLPAMPNLHSHAHQRLIAGWGEAANPKALDQANGDDNFWSWRQAMYRAIASLNPHDLEIVATCLYIDMVKAGYSHLCEFHYLHNDPAGYSRDLALEFSLALLRAARTAGIGITLLPVLYRWSGFGAQPPSEGQQRFILSLDHYGDLISDVKNKLADFPDAMIGIAPHSLRAVDKQDLQQLLALRQQMLPDCPVHIHIAEQQKEVDDCLAHYGKRPVEWLYDEFDIGPEWCLIHATHLTVAERKAITKSKAIVGLCPTTEANLGDGLFPFQDFHHEGGAYGIGSDSNICLSAAEELRLLEYGQRLFLQKRCVAGSGAAIYRQAVLGGRQAAGLAPLNQGNMNKALVVLNGNDPVLAGSKADQFIDSYVFSAGRNLVTNMLINGRHLVKNGQHLAEAESYHAYSQLRAKLL